MIARERAGSLSVDMEEEGARETTMIKRGKTVKISSDRHKSVMMKQNHEEIIDEFSIEQINVFSKKPFAYSRKTTKVPVGSSDRSRSQLGYGSVYLPKGSQDSRQKTMVGRN